MTVTAQSPARAPHRTYSRWTALVVLCAGTLMTILDGNIVTVAMPAVQSDLGFTGPGLGVGGQRVSDPVRRAAVAGGPAR